MTFVHLSFYHDIIYCDLIERARAKFKSFVHVLHYIRKEFLDDLSDSITFAQDFFFFFPDARL